MNLWKKLWQPTTKWWMLGMPFGAICAFVFGVLIWGGFNWTLELTNSEGFCISCHEMQSTVYPEYKQSIHYKNSAGVRASCSDCHVPRPWVHKVVRKIKASNELWHKLLGTIDTPEKFEAHRLTMAERVWQQMKANDSRECRNCHSFEFMDLAQQQKRAKRQHQAQITAEKGQTCIDCHKGIAHKLPNVDVVTQKQ